MGPDFIMSLLINIPAVLVAITVHEFSHALAAYKMGDTTAADQGRLSLNPLDHLDPIGTLMLIIFRFGWAKPVPINPYRFKNYKKGVIIVSLAGPASNLIMALAGAILARFVIPLGINVLSQFTYTFIFINIVLAIFNLLPIPPLDGSRLITVMIPPKYNHIAVFLERYGFLILVILLFGFPGIFSAVVQPIARYLLNLFLF